MKIRDILSIAGSFLTSFGAVLVASGESKGAWWTGTAFVILGPLLMGSRALVAAKKSTDAVDLPRVKD
jgi:hypothetical protein